MIPFIAWESTAPGAKKKKSNLRLKTVAGYVFLFAAMSCEIKLNNLQGGVITLDIPITATVRELKAMLLAKHPCQDPIERKILKVELLRDSSIIDDAETLDAAGFFCAESLVTVAYTRNEVEAATKDEIDDIHAQRCFGAKIPCNLTEISRYAFQNCRQLVLVSIEGSVTHIGAGAFAQCRSLTSISMGESVTHIGEQAFVGCRSLPSISMGESVRHIGDFAFAQCTSLTSISMGESVMHIGAFAFCAVHIFDKHQHGWVCDSHWGRSLLAVHIFDKHHVARVIETHFRTVESRIREQVLENHHHSFNTRQETTA